MLTELVPLLLHNIACIRLLRSPFPPALLTRAALAGTLRSLTSEVTVVETLWREPRLVPVSTSVSRLVTTAGAAAGPSCFEYIRAIYMLMPAKTMVMMLQTNPKKGKHIDH